MNILLLHTHDSGRFLQPYGYALETPHLKTLANGDAVSPSFQRRPNLFSQ